MARMLAGMAIASATTTMARERSDEGHGATALVGRDIGGLLAAEYRSLIIYSRRLTSNGPEAADLVHMVCARVLSQPTPIDGVENPPGWLRKVLFHAFVDLRRRARWEIPTDSAALELPAAPPETEAPGPQITIDDVRALLAVLPPRYRVPYELFTFEDMPYARIAVVLGLPCRTVGTRINRARERLRRLIRARYGG